MIPAIPPDDYRGSQADWMTALQSRGLWDGHGWHGDVMITNAQWKEILKDCEASDINRRRTELGLPKLPVLGEKGYKGKGMCGVCAFQGPKAPNTNKFMCTHYQATCISVSRNCPGTRMLKS